MYIKKDKTTASERIPDSYELTAEQERIVSEHYPWFELTIEDGVVVAVTPTERPQPVPPEPMEPSPEDDLAALAVDHEYRITLLELGVNDNAV